MAVQTTFGALQTENAAIQLQQNASETQTTDTSQTTQETQTQQSDGSTETQQQDSAAQTNQEDIYTSAFSLSLGDDDAQQTQQSTHQTQQQSQFNWKEEIKKISKDELIAELGLDPFAIEIDKHIKGGGQPIDYLQARAVDYNKFSDDALIKDSLRKEYPNLSPSQIDLMFNRKYNVPEDATDEDKEFFTAQLQADAYKIRQSKITEQQKFKIAETPIPQKDEAYEQWQQNRQQKAQNIEAAKNYFETHPATKALNESKRVTLNLGEGVSPFNFTVDKPELINRVLMDDGSAWNKLTSTPQGEPDVAKQQLLTLVAANPQKVFQDIYNYGVQMGERKRVAEGQNAQRQQAKVTQLDSTEKGTYRTGTYGKQ
jgi:hypothetical protein